VYLQAAIITIKQVTLAVVLVDLESTYPASGAAMLQRAQLYFPTLPILLLTPRVGGFSRSYATFELDQLMSEINADTIMWQEYGPAEQEAPIPF
jgi:hypothetical protein